MSMAMPRRAISSHSDCGAAGSTRSQGMQWTSIACAVRSSAASDSRRSARRAVSTSACTLLASSRANAAPMPADAPVTSANAGWVIDDSVGARRSGRVVVAGVARKWTQSHCERLSHARVPAILAPPCSSPWISMRRLLVAGNWKMHGSSAIADALVGAIAASLPAHADVAVLPPFPYLAELIQRHRGTALAFGAQDLSAHATGAYTGEVAGCHAEGRRLQPCTGRAFRTAPVPPRIR